MDQNNQADAADQLIQDSEPALDSVPPFVMWQIDAGSSPLTAVPGYCSR